MRLWGPGAGAWVLRTKRNGVNSLLFFSAACSKEAHANARFVSVKEAPAEYDRDFVEYEDGTVVRTEGRRQGNETL